ncbi:helix-turn-helix domain-containing protein [Lysinibacillus tabacifolii]|uniref:Helix-turn-helix domain-containing protein n=1 Tax=Lysinibacillus tabacifolii TaxID=1173107 RepID=A0ABY2SUZ9_9BACI|nr:hypothetical protein [Lysinibacillus tabacifolii]TKI46654.1 hypothetical protein FC748_17340 [Lysinibacillus tabacifolii]
MTNKKNQIISLNVNDIAPATNKNIGDMTLNEIFGDDEISIKKTKKSLKFIKETDEHTMVFSLKKKEGLQSVNQHIFQKTKDKTSIKKLAKELYKEGHTQEDIGDILGIHQSQVSLILRDKY